MEGGMGEVEREWEEVCERWKEDGRGAEKEIALVLWVINKWKPYEKVNYDEKNLTTLCYLNQEGNFSPHEID